MRKYWIVSPANSVLFLIGLAYCWLAYHYRIVGEDGNAWRYVVDSDGRGYYDYLLATFCRNDLLSLKVESHYLINAHEGVINKYSMGTALLISPFFLLAQLYNSITYSDLNNGLTYYNMLAVCGAAIFYLILGLYFIKKTLNLLGVKEWVIVITLIAIAFGTNILYYTVHTPAFSHVYSFCCISFFTMNSIAFVKNQNAKNFIGLIIGLALAILVRQFDVLIIFAIPLFLTWNNSLLFCLQFIRKRYMITLFGILLFSAIVGSQFLVWRLQSGKWMLFSYSNEGFYFNNPQFKEVLIGFRNGLFIYSPVIFIGFLFWIKLFFNDKKQLLTSLLFWILLLYILSSWYDYAYGECFGFRPFINYLSIWAITFACLLNTINKKIYKGLLIILCFVFSSISIAQQYQFERGIMVLYMTKQKYEYIFLKLSNDYRGVLGGIDDLPDYTTVGLKKVDSFKKINAKVVRLASIYSDTLITYIFDERLHKKKYYFNFLLNVLNKEQFASKNALVVINLEDRNHNILFSGAAKVVNIPIEKLNTWVRCNYNFRADVIPEKGYKLKVIIVNSELKNFLIDDVGFTIFDNS